MLGTVLLVKDDKIMIKHTVECENLSKTAYMQLNVEERLSTEWQCNNMSTVYYQKCSKGGLNSKGSILVKQGNAHV